jgi:hypothetical protein
MRVKRRSGDRVARQEPLAATFEEEPVPESDPRGGKAFLFLIVSVSAILFLGLSAWLNTVEIPELRDEIGYQRDTIFSLTEEIDTLYKDILTREEKISHLEAQLMPFRVLAVQRYGSNETKALKQIAEDVKELKKGVETSQTRDNL